MAKLRRNQVDKIVKRDMPGYRVASQRKRDGQKAGVDPGGRRPSMPADATTPDLESLRRKYLGSAAGNRTLGTKTDKADSANVARDDDEIVAVEPVEASHPWDRAARPKVVVISGKDKKIVGKQG